MLWQTLLRFIVRCPRMAPISYRISWRSVKTFKQLNCVACRHKTRCSNNPTSFHFLKRSSLFFAAAAGKWCFAFDRDVPEAWEIRSAIVVLMQWIFRQRFLGNICRSVPNYTSTHFRTPKMWQATRRSENFNLCSDNFH